MNASLSNSLKRFRSSTRCALMLGFFGGNLLVLNPAFAELKVCNQTESLLGVAIGYKTADQWVTEGWWRIPANICTSIIEGDLTSRYYYLRAESSEGGGRWRGPVFMCTSNKEFKIIGVRNCFARGYERAGFFEIDTAKQKNWQIRLTEANQTKKDDSSK